VAALSPAATLDRGYAVVRTPDGRIVRAAEDVSVGAPLRIRVARGDIDVTVVAASSSPSTPTP
jgi:exodeoxyribonuclease VII large subunit